MTDVKALGLNRQLVRAIYNKVDWDEYDREVVAESLPAYEAAVEALEMYLDFTASDHGGVECVEWHGDGCQYADARAALAGLSR